MIQSSDLATLAVRHIIFHDVPNNPKGGNAKPTLTNTETTTDAPRVAILQKRLRQVFGGGAAFDVEFLSASASPVPKLADTLTSSPPTQAEFVEASRKMANYLFSLQTGTVSPGLLCVLSVECRNRAGLSIMKLEREEGADLRLQIAGSHTSFEMSVLDSLVLTDGTRLFKSTLFLRDGSDIDCLACDTQSNPFSRSDVADFWLKFLGCRYVVDPRIATQQWFDASVEFVNDNVADPVSKQSLYEHIVSELNSNKHTVSPKKFIQDYVMKDLRQPYADFLKSKDVSTQQFAKDTSDIQSKLNRLSYHTEEGVTVIVPVDKERLVEVGKQKIVVLDKLRNISRK
jgi:hypothetical protein